MDRNGMNQRALALRLMGLGWYVATCIVVGVVGGVALDKLLNIAPLFTLLGVLLGTVAAFYGLYKMVRPLLSSDQYSKKPGNNGEDP